MLPSGWLATVPKLNELGVMLHAGGRKTKNGLDDNVLFPGNPTVPSVTPAYEVNYGSDGAGETTKTSAADCCESHVSRLQHSYRLRSILRGY